MSNELAVVTASTAVAVRRTTLGDEIAEMCAEQAAAAPKALAFARQTAVRSQSDYEIAVKRLARIKELQDQGERHRRNLVEGIKAETAAVDKFVRVSVREPLDQARDLIQAAIEPYRTAQAQRAAAEAEAAPLFANRPNELAGFTSAQLSALSAGLQRAADLYLQATGHAKRFWPDDAPHLESRHAVCAKLAGEYAGLAGIQRDQERMAAELAAQKQREAEAMAQQEAAARDAQFPFGPPPEIAAQELAAPAVVDSPQSIVPQPSPGAWGGTLPLPAPAPKGSPKLLWVVLSVDMAKLPDEYVRRIPDDRKIQAAIESGVAIPGVTAVQQAAPLR